MVFVRKPEGKKPIERLRPVGKDNIKIHLKGTA
jgi:hypothetical protein